MEFGRDKLEPDGIAGVDPELVRQERQGRVRQIGRLGAHRAGPFAGESRGWGCSGDQNSRRNRGHSCGNTLTKIVQHRFSPLVEKSLSFLPRKFDAIGVTRI